MTTSITLSQEEYDNLLLSKIKLLNLIKAMDLIARPVLHDHGGITLLRQFNDALNEARSEVLTSNEFFSIILPIDITVERTTTYAGDTMNVLFLRLHQHFNKYIKIIDSVNSLPKLTFEEIEDCFPEEERCFAVVDKEPITNAQWLHKFANNLIAYQNNKIKERVT